LGANGTHNTQIWYSAATKSTQNRRQRAMPPTTSVGIFCEMTALRRIPLQPMMRLIEPKIDLPLYPKLQLCGPRHNALWSTRSENLLTPSLCSAVQQEFTRESRWYLTSVNSLTKYHILLRIM
jgi:hypothetical protein